MKDKPNIREVLSEDMIQFTHEWLRIDDTWVKQDGYLQKTSICLKCECERYEFKAWILGNWHYWVTYYRNARSWDDCVPECWGGLNPI